MKITLLSLLLALSTAPAVHAAAELSDCARIESAVERLDCYDRLAGRQTGVPESGETREPAPEGKSRQDQPRAQAPPAASPSVTSPPAPVPPDVPQAEDAVPRDNGVDSFGKAPERAADEAIEFIEARIVSITRAPRGQHVMTLSNGQVWMENEADRRRIEADQDIVIRKRRWHYEMEFPSRPNVPVHRLK